MLREGRMEKPGCAFLKSGAETARSKGWRKWEVRWGKICAGVWLFFTGNYAELRLRLVQTGEEIPLCEGNWCHVSGFGCVRRSTSHNMLQSCPIMQKSRQTNSSIRNLFIIHLIRHVSALSVTYCRMVVQIVTFFTWHFPDELRSSTSYTTQTCKVTSFGPFTWHNRTYK
jgi:hypothetical protein